MDPSKATKDSCLNLDFHFSVVIVRTVPHRDLDRAPRRLSKPAKLASNPGMRMDMS
jgi:hypothetical protein